MLLVQEHGRTGRIGGVWLVGVLASAMGLAMVLGGCVVSGMAPLLEREVEQELAWQAGSAVHVQTGNGGIEVKRGEPGATTARIKATLQSESRERLDAATLLARFTEAGVLDVRVEWPDGRTESREGSRIRVFVPDAEGLQLTTTNGRIIAEGLAGEAVLRASNGSIEVRGHEGVVRGTTTNGNIRVEGCIGDMDLRSSNGAITLVDASGPVSVITTNGRAEVSLTEANAGPVKIQTNNGSATLRVGGAFIGELVLQTGNGSISTSLSGLSASEVESSRSRRVLRFGDSGEDVPGSSVKTTNGSISVTKR